jgi:hypothetical protein
VIVASSAAVVFFGASILIAPFLLSTAITVLGVVGIELKSLTDSRSVAEQALKASADANLGDKQDEPEHGN